MDNTSLDLFEKVSTALKGLADAVEQIEARLRLVEKLYDAQLIEEALKRVGLD
jgi:hypothetical protein